jgi:predicted lipoprotein with Yx(FWY)xxD motif
MKGVFKIVLPLLFAAFGVSVGLSQTYTFAEWSYTLNENFEATITSYSGEGGAVVIPANVGGYAVKTVGRRWQAVFGEGNTTVTSVVIPNSVTSIEGGAFSECYGLTSVTIGNGVTSIGTGAFYFCTSLASVIIPDSVTSIGEEAFGSCTSLASVTIGNGVTSIGSGAFAGCTSLTSVIIPDSVTSIGSGAFARCTSLTSVIIPDSVTSIGGDAFQACSGLIDVTIPSRFTAQIGAIGFTGQLATDLMADGLVEAIAQRVIASLPENYGIATKADLGEAISSATTQAIAQVQAAPNEYNLYDSTQYEANRITGVAEGKAEVTSNPTAYSLFTESSIMDMNLSSLMLKKGVNANDLDLELTIETKDNLASDGWQVSERIVRKVSMDGTQRQFLRVRADAPYVAPNVKVLAHPTLGNILTDGAGRVLYFFAADSPGGNPNFNGSSWPYVTVPEVPKADAGVAATLASSTFNLSGGPYLTVNDRPAYYYVGDNEAGQANGHGLGSVWWTIRADGVINQ